MTTPTFPGFALISATLLLQKCYSFWGEGEMGDFREDIAQLHQMRALAENPNDLLSEWARSRIRQAAKEAIQELDRLKLNLENRGILQTREGRLETKTACVYQQISLLDLQAEEFRMLELPKRLFREIMRKKIDRAAEVLSLSNLQKQAIETEICGLSKHTDNPQRKNEKGRVGVYLRARKIRSPRRDGLRVVARTIGE
jgi:hypothetical protein